MTDSVAWIGEVGIGVVLDPDLTSRTQVVAKFLPRDLEQGPNHLTPLGVDAAQPGQPGPANQLQQKRLGLVVAGVSDGNAAGVDIGGAAAEGLVPEPASRVLNREPLRRRIRPDVDGLDRDGQLETLRQVAAEVLVSAGLGAQLVIHVGEADYAETGMFGEFTKEQGQGDRVRPAGDTNQHTTARRTQRVPTDGAADFLVEPIQCSMLNAQCPIPPCCVLEHWALGIEH